MLPMTTRKKLSHLRAQIRRQASKAARLEKRSSSIAGTSYNFNYTDCDSSPTKCTDSDKCGTDASTDAGGGDSGGPGGGLDTDLDTTQLSTQRLSQQPQHQQHHHHHHQQPQPTTSSQHVFTSSSSSTSKTSKPSINSTSAISTNIELVQQKHTTNTTTYSKNKHSKLDSSHSDMPSQHHQQQLLNMSKSFDSPNVNLSSTSSSGPSNFPPQSRDIIATSSGDTQPGDYKNNSGENKNQNISTSSAGGSGNTKHSGGLSVPGRFHKHLSARLNSASVNQKNFKQRLMALMKKFRSNAEFDSEEQYREALERELMKAAAGRGSKAIEELLEGDDLDGDDAATAGSGSEPDWDRLSETSTPKPSLRPFFSSTTLDKI